MIRPLTQREKYAAQMLRDGYKREEMCWMLEVSRTTLTMLLKSVYHKLEVPGQVELVADLLLPLDSPLRQRSR